MRRFVRRTGFRSSATSMIESQFNRIAITPASTVRHRKTQHASATGVDVGACTSPCAAAQCSVPANGNANKAQARHTRIVRRIEPSAIDKVISLTRCRATWLWRSTGEMITDSTGAVHSARMRITATPCVGCFTLARLLANYLVTDSGSRSPGFIANLRWID